MKTTDDIADAMDYNFVPGDCVQPMVTNPVFANEKGHGIVLSVIKDRGMCIVLWTCGPRTWVSGLIPNYCLMKVKA